MLPRRAVPAVHTLVREASGRKRVLRDFFSAYVAAGLQTGPGAGLKTRGYVLTFSQESGAALRQVCPAICETHH